MDLEQLANLVDLMRAKGVAVVDVNGVRVQLGPVPDVSAGDGVLIDADVESERKAREERQRYEATLYRSAG